MVLAGKLQAETLIKGHAHKFHDIFCRRPHHISNVCPEKIQKVHLHEGDWGTPGSVIEWSYAIDGNNLKSKQLIEAIDEENKCITFKAIGGDLLKEYKSYKATLQTIQKGDFTLLCWTLEYEKLHKDISPPLKELGFLIHLNDRVDDHLLLPA